MISYRSIQISPKKITNAIFAVADSYCLSAKNVRNSSIFISNNLISAYQYHPDTQTYVLKDKLHENQKDSIAYFNLAVDAYNENKKPDLQLQKFTSSISVKVQRQHLNKSLVEKALKLSEKDKADAQRSYSCTHSYVAQMILQKTVSDYQHYYKALAAWYKTPKAFTGRPQLPSYYDRNGRATIEFDISRLTKEGYLARVKNNFKLYRQFQDLNPLTEAEIDAYNSFNFRKLIEEDLKNRKIQGEPVSIRFVPTGKLKCPIKIEYVVKLNIAATGACAVVEQMDNEFFGLSAKKQNTLVNEYYKDREPPAAMGIDLGYNNAATLAYSNRDQKINRVVSSRDFITRINKIDTRIDSLISRLSAALPNRASLIKKQLDKQKLTVSERRQLRQADKQIHSNDQLIKLRQQKSQITHDWLHKLSNSILSEAKRNNIEYIVVGKNRFWKQELDLGKTQNRKGYNIPHARLIELLKYKAIPAGIVVLETEESYTSKTSFVTNETLKQYAPGADGKTTNSQLLGKRTSNKFKIGKKTYHADINGAFNIIRKVFGKFAYDPLKVSLSYVLSELKMYGKRYFYDFNRLLYGDLANPSSCAL